MFVGLAIGFSGAWPSHGAAIPKLDVIRCADYVNYTQLAFEITEKGALETKIYPLRTGKAPILIVELKGVQTGLISNDCHLDGTYIRKASISYSSHYDTLTVTIPCHPNVNLEGMVWNVWEDMVTVDIPLFEPNHAFVPPVDEIQKHKEKGGKVVVLDPGHGAFHDNDGGDYIRYPRLTEKEVVLDLGWRIKKLMDQDPKLLTLLTRYGDYLPVPFGLKGRTREEYKTASLSYRVQLAKEYLGDAYISLHLNAISGPRQKTAKGFEVYFLGEEHANDLVNNPDVEELSLLGIEEEGKKDSELSNVLLLMNKDYVQQQSINLAATITREVAGLPWITLRERPMKSQRFVVLRQLVMPSVLVEFLFRTHPQEHEYIRSARNRNQLAEAVYKAVNAFFFEPAKPIPPDIYSPRPVEIAHAAQTPTVQAPKPAPKATPVPSRGPVYHTVKSGESLSAIASRYGVSTTRLRQLNPGKIDKRNRIDRGDRLLISQGTARSAAAAPAKSTSSSEPRHDIVFTYTVKSGDTLGTIAAKYSSTVEELKTFNRKRSIQIKPGEKLRIPGHRDIRLASAQTTEYKVQRGDSLDEIAKQYKTTPQRLKSLNRLQKSTIHPGQVLRVR
ncbi:MAG: LysM peptidoglycan-binding domain-containing protein [bacterium]